MGLGGDHVIGGRVPSSAVAAAMICWFPDHICLGLANPLCGRYPWCTKVRSHRGETGPYNPGRPIPYHSKVHARL